MKPVNRYILTGPEPVKGKKMTPHPQKGSFEGISQGWQQKRNPTVRNIFSWYGLLEKSKNSQNVKFGLLSGDKKRDPYLQN